MEKVFIAWRAGLNGLDKNDVKAFETKRQLIKFLNSTNDGYVWQEAKIKKRWEKLDKERDTKNCNISDVITPFWLWLVREANVDVIDAENAIEVHGFNADNKPLTPVISFKELIELYKSQNGL